MDRRLQLWQEPFVSLNNSPPSTASLKHFLFLPPSTLVDPFQARAVEGGKGAAEEIDSSRVVETKMAKIAGNSGCDDD